MVKNPERLLLSVSVFELKAEGVLRGRTKMLRWTDGSRLRVSAGVDEVFLGSVPVALVYTKLHSGGLRPWFVCTACSRRCARLYLLTSWACHSCSRVAYESTHDKRRQQAQILNAEARRQQPGRMAGRWPYLERKLLERRQRLVNRIRRMD